MISGFLITLCFLAGVLIGRLTDLQALTAFHSATEYVLLLLLFAVGIGMGGSSDTFRMLKQLNARILLLPVSIIIGSMGGAALFAMALDTISVQDAMGVVSGFGYYSLSSILITEIRNETLGVIALLSNIIREIFTLLLAPLLVRIAGNLAPIAAGGATAMDTTLPVIVRFAGKEYGIPAVFSGVFLTVAAPLIIALIFSI